MDTLDVVKEILSDNLDIDPNDVTEESTIESLGIDSLDMVELICEVEDRLDIEFDDETDSIITLGDFCEHVDALK